MKKLSVVIPAYNEQRRLEKTLLAISAFLERQDFDYEILVVNDGSKDKTAEVALQLAGRIKNLNVLDNKQNRGKGWVTKQGMLAATGDIRLFMDADNSTSIDQVTGMLPFFEQGFDLVIGSRRVSGSNIAVRQPWLRDFLGAIFRLIVRLIVPLGVTDSQCGFKAFTGKASETIFSQQTIYRWAFDVEILALAKKNKLKIKEVPVTWANDAESHVKFAGEANMLLEILKIRWNFLTGKYKEKISGLQ